MSSGRVAYRNPNWFQFAELVKRRDGYCCCHCGRTRDEAVLQVHHKAYVQGRESYNYPLSDCVTLCKGCHAQQHGLIQPRTGWTLVCINDLGGSYGTCEREHCGKDIRYEHVTYHPKFGYLSVGSKCIEHLTEDDQYTSSKALSILEAVSEMILPHKIAQGKTKNGHSFVFFKYNHHVVRVYGTEPKLGVQVALKIQGMRRFDFKKTRTYSGITIERALELGALLLRGYLNDDEEIRELLGDIYRATRPY